MQIDPSTATSYGISGDSPVHLGIGNEIWTTVTYGEMPLHQQVVSVELDVFFT